MAKVKLNLIAAAAENMGIGLNGTLPWKLRNEMAYFQTMTTKVSDPTKKNAVIMGRRSWDSIPIKYRPLSDRVNIVMTRNVEEVNKKVPEGVVVVSGLEEAINYISNNKGIENTWVIGGADIYRAAMDHANCDKIYLTEIQKQFECDTFFPKFDKDQYTLITEDGVPEEKQTEGDISYYFRIYKKL